MMCNKYKITREKLHFNGIVLHRIEALIDFNNVKKGDKGGWIENKSNLSQVGNCWVYDDAVVCNDAWVGGNAVVRDKAMMCNDAVVRDNALVCGKALVSDNAVVKDNASVKGYSVVSGKALVSDNAVVCDNAEVCGNANICGDAIIEKMGDYIVFHNWWSSGRFFTYTKSNNMWKVGCFYGTGEQLIKKAYADNEEKGKMYEKIVKLVKE